MAATELKQGGYPTKISFVDYRNKAEDIEGVFFEVIRLQK